MSINDNFILIHSKCVYISGNTLYVIILLFLRCILCLVTLSWECDFMLSH